MYLKVVLNTEKYKPVFTCILFC